MATVTGYTAERMLEIENSTVVDGDVVGDDLVLLQRDGTPINAGSVRGPQGVAGPTGPTSIAVATSSTRPTGGSLFEGLGLHETDTKRFYIYDGTAWKYRGGIWICTSSTRPASPFAGLEIFETDTKKYYIYNGTAWSLPVNIPGGLVATGGSVIDQTIANSSGEFGSNITVPWTAVAGRQYKVTFHARAITSSVAQDTIDIKIKESSTVLGMCSATLPTANGLAPCNIMVPILSPSAGAHSYQIVVSRPFGTGTGGFSANAAYPATLMIEDIGGA